MPSPPPPWYRWEGATLLLSLRLQPRASRDEFCGVVDGRLRVRVTAPPVEGKANDHLLRLLAREFGVSRGAITLIAGEGAREKRVCIAHPARLPQGLGIVRSVT